MSFDALAPHYRWMEFVLAGDKLQRCRTAFLDRVKGARNILTVGEGNGRFLASLMAAVNGASITCVDASEQMLARARARLQRLGLRPDKVYFLHADAREWNAPRETFDVIVTHFFLDCFRSDELERIIEKLSRSARAEAAWLIADFQVPSAGVRRARALMIHRLMYTFFRVATRLPARTLTAPDALLEKHGFRLVARRTSELDLLHSDMWVRGKD